ncbi:MAG: hypothetical protein OXG25_06615 [Gammaproteobacteria bacterium]|nr:hypothetical protein [Gammaproteobacteria bacterium]
MSSDSEVLPIQGRYARAQLGAFRIEEAGINEFHIEAIFTVKMSDGSTETRSVGPYRKDLDDILAQSGANLVMEAYNKLPSEFRS